MFGSFTGFYPLAVISGMVPPSYGDINKSIPWGDYPSTGENHLGYNNSVPFSL